MTSAAGSSGGPVDLATLLSVATATPDPERAAASMIASGARPMTPQVVSDEGEAVWVARLLPVWRAKRRQGWTLARLLAYAISDAGQPPAVLGDDALIEAIERRARMP